MCPNTEVYWKKMRKIHYKLFLFALSCAISVLFQVFTSSGQLKAQGKGNTYTAIILDKSTGEPVEFATVSARYIGEQTSTHYALTKEDGSVVLDRMKVGRATITVEYMGYKKLTYTFDVKRGANDGGKVQLEPDVNLLDAVVVTDVGNQMVVKKDTLEYNASVFKTNESDMLEELLKKLPGVEISSDGTITANGKEIKKIMIDGKTFFLDDPQLATKNIPAKIVDKVRVVERKSDQARFTGIDDGEEENVLDLGIKKGMMNGWFGNLMGGYGTEERYQGAGIVAKFTDKSQLSIIGNINNTNNRGFMDVAASMMGTLRQGGRGGRGGGGGMFPSRSGITTSRLGGVNATRDYLNGKLKLTGSYMYSSSDKDVREKTDKETFLKSGGSMFNLEDAKDNTFAQGHRANGELEWTISDNTSILFRPYANFNSGDFREESMFSTRTGDDPTNDGNSLNTGNNESQSAGGRFLFRQKLGKPGRTLSLMLNFQYQNNEIEGNNYSLTNYYQDGEFSSKSVINQDYNRNEISKNMMGRFSYTEPLGKNYFVEAAYRYNWKRTNSDKDTWDILESGERKWNEEYSAHYENTFTTQRFELSFMKQEEKYNFNIGVTYEPAKTESTGLARDTTYSTGNFAPMARFDFRFTEDKFLRISYRGRSQQPSITQMMPIADNSNPLLVQLGNMNLQPSFTNSLWAEYRSNNRKNFSWFGVTLEGSYKTDNIVTQKYYDENGVQYTQPVNDNTGIYNISGRVMMNRPIGKSKFTIMSFTFLSFGNGVSFVSDNDAFVKNITKNFSVSENARIMYRTDDVELSAGARVRYNNAWYTVESMSNSNPSTWSNTYSVGANINLPWNFNITTDYNFTHYIGYGAGYDDPSQVWNAEISKTFLKNFTLKAKVFDILADARNTYRTTTEDYVQDVQNNTLGRYVMFSLVWRFGKFGNGSGGMGMGHGPMGHGPRGGRR